VLTIDFLAILLEEATRLTARRCAIELIREASVYVCLSELHSEAFRDTTPYLLFSPRTGFALGILDSFFVVAPAAYHFAYLTARLLCAVAIFLILLFWLLVTATFTQRRLPPALYAAWSLDFLCSRRHVSWFCVSRCGLGCFWGRWGESEMWEKCLLNVYAHHSRAGGMDVYMKGLCGGERR
jgi:hypothetical protein